MAPTRRRRRSVSTPALSQVRYCRRPLRHRRRCSPCPQPPTTSSSLMAPARRRRHSVSHSATTPAHILPDGSSSSPRMGSPVDSGASLANPMKVRAIGGDGDGNMSLHKERSDLELDCVGSVKTLDPSSSSKEAMDADDEEVVPSGKRARLFPLQLLEFLKDEGEDVRGDGVKLLALVVHDLLLDRGFVSIDSLQHGCDASFTDKTLKLRYTLPSLLHAHSTSVDSVDLLFVTLRNIVYIHGRVPGNASSSVSLFLDTSRYGNLRTMYMWEDLATLDDGEEKEQILEVLKIMKDRLLVPLHIGIRDKAGLPLPPCFMRLPTDVQIKILELLPWSDLAKMACVCSAMKGLASDDELWRQKYGEVVGEVDMAGAGETSWKDKFGASLRSRKMMEREMARRRVPLPSISGSCCPWRPGMPTPRPQPTFLVGETASPFKQVPALLPYTTCKNPYGTSEQHASRFNILPAIPGMIPIHGYNTVASTGRCLAMPIPLPILLSVL